MDTLSEFLMVWSHSDLSHDVAGSLSCSEVDALASLLRDNGHEESAEHWISVHAQQDDEGDSHFNA